MWLGYMLDNDVLMNGLRKSNWYCNQPYGWNEDHVIALNGDILTGGYTSIKGTSNSGTLIQQLTEMTSAVNVLILIRMDTSLLVQRGLYVTILQIMTYEMISSHQIHKLSTQPN